MKQKLVIDTDCGTDDLMALAYLTQHPGIEIEAITTVRGLASARTGAENLSRVLDRLGISDIPIYVGSESPQGEFRSFPGAWMEQTEALSGVLLPSLVPRLQCETAYGYYHRRLSESVRMSILALGPLTNIGSAIARITPFGNFPEVDLHIMGGAIDVLGNLSGGGTVEAHNQYAEWNFFIDPLAVHQVLMAGLRTKIISLDVTNQVPIRSSLIKKLETGPSTEATRLVLEILAGVKDWILDGQYYAWDPLAAVLLANSDLGRFSTERILVEVDGLASGRIFRDSGGFDVSICEFAALEAFESEFASVLGGVT